MDGRSPITLFIGKCFKYVHELKKHIAALKELVAMEIYTESINKEA